MIILQAYQRYMLKERLGHSDKLFWGILEDFGH